MRDQLDEFIFGPPWSEWLAAIVLLGSCLVLALTQLAPR